MSEKIETKEKDTEPEWLPNKFNQAASEKEIILIQERVQARFKCSELTDGIRKGIDASCAIPTEAKEHIVIMSLYMHTAFEIGFQAGLNDLDKLVDNVISKGHKPPEGFNKEMLKDL